MKKILPLIFILAFSVSSQATVKVIYVWNGYYQFVSNFVTIQLGDTVQWLPLDQPFDVHTITSTNIPTGAATFDYTWQLPSDTFFQYIPQFPGVYDYECTPHAFMGMVGTIIVQNVSSINGHYVSEDEFTIYPNPAIDIIRFDAMKSDMVYNVYDVNGKLTLTGTTGNAIGISTLGRGAYILELVGDRPRRLRFLKE